MARTEVGDRLRDDRRTRGWERGESHPAASHARERLELGLGLGQVGEHGFGVAHERLAGIRQSDAARVALDELGARLALEGGDLLRHRGLGVGQRVSRGGERTLVGDLAEHSHPAHIKHKRSLSLLARSVI